MTIEGPRSPTFSEKLEGIYGPQIRKVLSALPTEMGVIEEMPGSFTVKDALIQSLVWEISTSYQLVSDFFKIAGDSLVYFQRELMETPGYNEGRAEFDRRLIAFYRNRNSYLKEDPDVSDILTNKATFLKVLKGV